ncbi:MAG TPA: Hpt domain-containing protein [Burkholderiaceae bacterium]
MDELQRRLAALNDKFRAQLPAQLDEIERAMAACAMREGADPMAARSLMQHLYRALHGLSGAAGTFGMADLGHDAYAMEQRLQNVLALPEAQWPPAIAALQSQLGDWLALVRLRLAA